MNDQSNQDSTAAVAANPGMASRPVLLTQAREASGLHIAALAAALKVPVKKLEALEAGRYDELPDLVFARALASSACRQLKVDAAPVLAQIPASLTPPLGDSPAAINTPFKSPLAGGVGLPVDGWMSRPSLWIALVFVLAALLLMFLPDMSAPTPAPTAAVPAPVAATAPAVPSVAAPAAPVVAVATVPAPSEPAAAPQPAEPVPAVSPTPAAPAALAVVPAATPVAVAAAPVATPEPAAVPAVPVDAKKVLTIRATGESWVQVVDGEGAVLIQRMFKVGDVVDFSATPPYKVVVGRVDNAEVWIRGKAFDATPFARSGVARFEVK